jgi:uncharacterized protein YbjT (DUF2867 family)
MGGDLFITVALSFPGEDGGGCMILVVGATGLVGSDVCRKLSARGEQVRGLVRVTSSQEKRVIETFGLTLTNVDQYARGVLAKAATA